MYPLTPYHLVKKGAIRDIQTVKILTTEVPVLAQIYQSVPDKTVEENSPRVLRLMAKFCKMFVGQILQRPIGYDGLFLPCSVGCAGCMYPDI